MRKLVFILFFFSVAVLSATDVFVNVSEEGAGTNCDNGGAKIEIIEDTNESHVFDEGDVIKSTQYVCNGIDGSDGAAPAVSVTEEPAGGMCGSAGGIKVVVGSDTKYVCNGADGLKAVSRTSVEAPGENCENGGIKIEVGNDKNANNSLDDDEVEADQTKYACNGNDGSNGQNALAKISDEPKGANCPNSTGVKIEVGIDTNKNGELDESEVTNTQYVCGGKNGSQGPQGSKGEQGEPGVNGTDGKDGEQGEKGETGAKGDTGPQGEQGEQGEPGRNGVTTLVSVTDEPKGENCETGGKKIETGLDANANGVLDEDEINPDNIYYVCNGMNAEEAGLTSSSSGCAMTSVDGGFDWIYAFFAALSIFFAFLTIKIARR